MTAAFDVAGDIVEHQAEALTSGAGDRRGWYTLAIFLLLAFTVGIELTIFTLLVHPIEATLRINDFGFASVTAIPIAIGVAATYYPSGLLSDTFRRRDIILFGTGLWTVGAVVAAHAVTTSWFFFAQLLAGIGTGIPGPAIFSVLTDAFSRKRRAFAISVYNAVASVIGAAIYIACEYLVELTQRFGTFHLLNMQVLPWQQCFAFCGILGIITLGFAFTIPEPARMERVTHNTLSLESTLRVFVQYLKRHWLLWALLALGDQIGITSVYAAGSWAPAFGLRHYGATGVSAIALLGIFTAAGALLGSIGGGFFAQRAINHGDSRLLPRAIIGVMLIGSVFAISFPFMPSWFWALIGIAGLNALSAALGVLITIGLQETASNEVRGQLYGVWGVMSFIPSIVGAGLVASLASGVLAKAGGLGPAMALVGGITSILGVLMFAFAVGPYERAKQEMRLLFPSQNETEVQVAW